jgi:ubiquitin carboxyl-terminal hydrolase 4/11/15
MPDVTDGTNMAIAGARAWDAHKRRNDSLVMDTFYGQFQSTCVCPKCQKVSVSFDAFNHISLEIPRLNKTTVTIPILVFREKAGKAPYRYGVTLQRQSLITDLKGALGKMTGIPAGKLILADLYEHNIYELLNEKKVVSSIRPTDVIGAFEVEPYSNETIHVVATHVTKVLDQTGKEESTFFGHPIMTSFSADSSCKEVWQHVCNSVSHLVCEEKGGVDGYIDKQKKNRLEDILQVHVIDNGREAREVFPSSSEDNPRMTSLLPVNSSESIRKYLGNDCLKTFLFFSLEWKHSNEDDKNKVIDPKSFMSYSDHQTLIDAMKSQRAKTTTKGVSLDQCFESFSKPERLDENNMWYCAKCKEHVRALKTMKLWRLPNILVVHLKRFEFKHALRRDKLDTFVDFPLEGLDMNKYCAHWKPLGKEKSFLNPTVPTDYDLFGVVNHMGRLGFGHYTAFARRWDEISMSDFALFDDSSVRNIGTGPEGIVTPAAYVLFYRRRTFN